ncbi:hypothetical protein EX30DRAFT_20880 [Ascodesmis nigricans]|uniref:Uncharacterized protein n=1 Tax=Ascodesmis nigricans TaxID=341454 RepID=A0A4S2N7L8_9PEZI|nr:hypothetical protein EX30DRAFT_20880 [Ascodesmis nigricans]
MARKTDTSHCPAKQINSRISLPPSLFLHQPHATLLIAISHHYVPFQRPSIKPRTQQPRPYIHQARPSIIAKSHAYRGHRPELSPPSSS